MALQVRDVMTADPDTVSPDTLLVEVANLILEKRYSGLPVIDDDGVPVGVVEVGNLLPRPQNVPATNIPVLQFQGEWVEEGEIDRFLKALRETPVGDVMREDFAHIGSNAGLGDTLNLLVAGEQRRILVIDPESNELLGVITRTDFLRVLTGGV